MNEKKIFAAENLHLLSIKVINGSISGSHDNGNSKIKQFSIDYKTETGTWLEEEQVRTTFIVEMVAMDEEGIHMDIKASYTIDFIFKIDGLKDLAIKTDETIKLDRGLGAMLIGVVYSTVRGIVWSRAQGTILEDVVLPVIDPFTLIPVTDP